MRGAAWRMRFSGLTGLLDKPSLPHPHRDTVIRRADRAVGARQFIGPVRFLCGVALCTVWRRTRSPMSPVSGAELTELGRPGQSALRNVVSK
jgi:hypothetical protein